MPDQTDQQLADQQRANELLPEWPAFRDAVADRDPERGTACATWTVRDLVRHQIGSAVELGRVLSAHLDGETVPPTRTFEEREAPYLRTSFDECRGILQRAVEDLAGVVDRARGEPGALIPWTGRQMRAAAFGEHMRSELILHRWDLTGDDDINTEHLGQRWVLEHAVEDVGAPLLKARAGRAGDERFSARIRSEGQPDVLLTGGPAPSVELAPESGGGDLVTDPAARVLLLWGRQPADPSRLRSCSELYPRIRTLLAGY